MSRASANSVPKKCANLYTKGTFCDWKCTNSEKRHCSEQLFSSCLLFASVVYGTGTYADRKFQASGRISDIFRPNKLARNSFQCIHAHHLFECSKIQRRKVTFVSNVTMYLQLRLNFKLKRLKRHAYSHGILDNSFFLFLFHNNIASFVLALAAFYFFMLLKFFVCASPNKINYACNCRNLFMFRCCS